MSYLKVWGDWYQHSRYVLLLVPCPRFDHISINYSIRIYSYHERHQGQPWRLQRCPKGGLRWNCQCLQNRTITFGYRFYSSLITWFPLILPRFKDKVIPESLNFLQRDYAANYHAALVLFTSLQQLFVRIGISLEMLLNAFGTKVLSIRSGTTIII